MAKPEAKNQNKLKITNPHRPGDFSPVLQIPNTSDRHQNASHHAFL